MIENNILKHCFWEKGHKIKMYKIALLVVCGILRRSHSEAFDYEDVLF